MRFPALQSRNFAIYMAGNVSATNAIWINRVIIGWLGWELTGLAVWVGLLSFLLYAPIVLSPVFGVILDRVDLRRVIIAIQTTLAAIVATLLVLYVLGLLTVWFLALVAMAIGVTASADRTIRFLLVPRLVDKDALANAIAIQGINFNTARLVGPAIGGLLIDLAGSGVAMAVNLAMILPFLAALFVVRLRDRDTERPKRQRLIAEILDGARHAIGRQVLRDGMILSGVFSITLSGILEILPAIADGVFGRGAQGLGQILAAAGAGGLAAALFVALRRSGPSLHGIPLAVYVSVFSGCVAAVVLGVSANWFVSLAMVFVLGGCLTIIQIDLQAALQIALSDTYRGRVMSLWVVLVIGGVAVSAIVLGLLADILGISAALVCSGVACAAVVGASMLGRGKKGGPPPSA